MRHDDHRPEDADAPRGTEASGERDGRTTGEPDPAPHTPRTGGTAQPFTDRAAGPEASPDPTEDSSTTDEVEAGLAPVFGGGELFYEVAGSGPAIVLLHGGMLDNHMWDEQFAWLRRTEHRVVRYDARGHGLSSDIDGDYAHHEDLAALLHHLGIGRATLVGLSHGARVALDLALTRPESVHALALASPGISGRAFTDPFLLDHIRQQVAAADGPHATEWYVEHFLRMWVDGPHRTPGAVDPELRERLRDSATANAEAHPSGFSAGIAREADAWSHLTELDVPTLILDGDLDASDISANAHALALTLPGAHRVRIPAAAHMVNLENPIAFDTALRDFLERVGG